MTPSHNLRALLMGTGEFSFCLNAATAAQASQLGYRDVGNITAFKIESSGDKKEHYGSYRGTTRRDGVRMQKLKTGYELTCDEWDLLKMQTMLFGGTANAVTRPALAAAAGTALVFSNGAPSNPALWYDVLSAGGVRANRLTAVTFPGLTEGTDFEVDSKLGRVRFITAQVANATPTITAAAIVAGDINSMLRFTPMTRGVFNGIGRLVLFDEDDANNIVYEHTDFGCEVAVNGTPDVKSDDYSTISLTVTVTSPLGNADTRNA